MLAWWRTSTYQPQPLMLGEPSTSQLGPEVLQWTLITTPSVTTRIGVSRASERSTPSCRGRASVRNPPNPYGLGTGAIQAPVNGMSVGCDWAGVWFRAGPAAGRGVHGRIRRRLSRLT